MPSVTFHAVCTASNRRKDGTTPVRIRVTFKGKHRRLPTNLVAYPGDLTRAQHIKNPDIIRRAADLIARMQDTLRDVSPFALEAWDVDRVVAHITARLREAEFRLDFFAFADEFIQGKTPTTRRAYTMALGALARFLGRRELDVNGLTRALLLDFVAFIDAEPKMHYDPRTGEWRATGLEKGTGAASRHLMKLEHIFRAAKLKYNDDDRVLIPRSPFDGIPRNYGQPEGEKALAPEVMQRILSAEAQGVERVALDAFILSFATMGANLADLYAARRFAGPVWCYCRKKITSRRAEMRVTLPPEVAPVLGRLAGRGEWWLGELHRIAGRAELATPKVNAALRRWAAREGLEPFTFYAARKSWATYARNICGIEKATIDEALAHKGDYALADIYITRSWDHLNEANRRVLALFSWEGADPRQEGR